MNPNGEPKPDQRRSLRQQLNRAVAGLGIAAVSSGVLVEQALAKTSPNVGGGAKITAIGSRGLASAEQSPPGKNYQDFLWHRGQYKPFSEIKPILTQEIKDLRTFLQEIKSSKDTQQFFGAVVIKTKPGHVINRTYPGSDKYDLVPELGPRAPGLMEEPIINPLIKEFDGKKYLFSFNYTDQLGPGSAPNTFLDTTYYDEFLTSVKKAKSLDQVGDGINRDDATMFSYYYSSYRIFDLGELKKEVAQGKASVEFWQYGDGHFKPKMVHTKMSPDGKTVFQNEPGYPPVGFMADYGMPQNDRDQGFTAAQYLKSVGFQPMSAAFKKPF